MGNNFSTREEKIMKDPKKGLREIIITEPESVHVKKLKKVKIKSQEEVGKILGILNNLKTLEKNIQFKNLPPGYKLTYRDSNIQIKAFFSFYTNKSIILYQSENVGYYRLPEELENLIKPYIEKLSFG